MPSIMQESSRSSTPYSSRSSTPQSSRYSTPQSSRSSTPLSSPSWTPEPSLPLGTFYVEYSSSVEYGSRIEAFKSMLAMWIQANTCYVVGVEPVRIGSDDDSNIHEELKEVGNPLLFREIPLVLDSVSNYTLILPGHKILPDVSIVWGEASVVSGTNDRIVNVHDGFYHVNDLGDDEIHSPADMWIVAPDMPETVVWVVYNNKTIEVIRGSAVRAAAGCVIYVGTPPGGNPFYAEEGHARQWCIRE